MNTTFFRHTHTHTHSSLVPRPPPFFVLWFAFSIIHGSGRARKTGKTWSHPSCVWTWGGHREEGPNHKNNALVHPFKCSTAVLDVKMLAWSKVLVFTCKKIALRVYSYIVEYWHLPLTSLSRPPCIHLTSHTWRMRLGLPRFCALPLPCITLNTNRRTKNRGGLGTRLHTLYNQLLHHLASLLTHY